MNDMNNKPTWPGWETKEALGRGTYGAVYRIERELFGTKEQAALKVISISEGYNLANNGYSAADISAAMKDWIERIGGEYLLMRKMNGSSNIVTCDDILMEQSADGMSVDMLIKMELLTPLGDALPTKFIPESVAVRVGIDLAKALVLCAKNNIIHRDIKPANIFLSPNGDYKLGDFGVARIMENTMSATRAGTFNYMSPEVYINRPYSAGADIYSLGLVLYWMMNERRTPFLPLPPELPKMGDMEAALLRRMSGEPLPEPKNGSQDLKRIILKACAYRPEDRYQNALELLEALEALERGNHPTQKTAHTVAREQPVTQTNPKVKKESNEPKQKSAEKSLTLILSVGFLLIVAIVVLFGNHSPKTKTFYDTLGNVDYISEYDNDGNEIRATYYDTTGNVRGWNENEFDATGEKSKTTRYRNNGSVLFINEYDNIGNVKTRVEFNVDGSIAHWYEYEYDSYGNAIKRTSYNSDGTVFWEYDGNGNVSR